MKKNRKQFYEDVRAFQSRINIPYRLAKKLLSGPSQIEGVIVELVSKQMRKDFANFAKDLERMQAKALRVDYSQKATFQGFFKTVGV